MQRNSVISKYLLGFALLYPAYGPLLGSGNFKLIDFMITQPITISIIAWLLIILAISCLVLESIYAVTATRDFIIDSISNEPMLTPMQFAISYVPIAVYIVSGVAMLKNQDWGRWFYIIASSALLIFVVNYSLNMIDIIYIILVSSFSILLYLPAANQYFMSSRLPIEALQARNKLGKIYLTSIRNALGIILLVLAGFLLFVATGYSYLSIDVMHGKWIKTFAVIAFVSVLMFLGLALTSFKNRKQIIGIVFLGSSSFNIVYLLVLGVLFTTEGSNETPAGESIWRYYDFISGSAFLLISICAGWILVRNSIARTQ
jgi:hypothetical protein